jgi:hypothetical protein
MRFFWAPNARLTASGFRIGAPLVWRPAGRIIGQRFPDQGRGSIAPHDPERHQYR